MVSIATDQARAAKPPGPRFAPQHPWDRNFFLAYLALIWLGLLMGFGSDVIRHVKTHEAPYPLIVHFHAAIFVSWPLLLAAQIGLIRTRNLTVHRKLGLAMIGLALAMCLIGPTTALIVDAAKVGTPDSDPAFLSIQFADIAAFSLLVGAAIVFRATPAAHKRLILLASLYIADAGYARWLAPTILKLTGFGFWGFATGLYLPVDLLVLGIGAYDLITRRRLHPAYLAGAAVVFCAQLAAVSLYFSPAWKALALHLLGH